MNVLVVYGGISSEREISIITSKYVIEALKTNSAFNVSSYDFTGDTIDFINTIRSFGGDVVVFNATHGTFSEDGRMQAIMDLEGVKYTHSGFYASAVSMNKIFTKHIASNIGIKTPKFIHSNILKNLSNQEIINHIDKEIGYPCVIKNATEGSSIDVFLCENEKEANAAINKIDINNLLIEEYIKGIEVTVGIVNNKPLAVTEIVPSEAFYNFESKYKSQDTKQILPARISKDLYDNVMNQALKLYGEVGCKSPARVDFLIKNNESFFLEINTQPGLTNKSLLPNQCKYAGISFNEFCSSLINLVV